MHQGRNYPYMVSGMRRRIGLVLALAFMTAVLGGCGAGVKTDQPLPGISLKDQNGQTVSVPQSFKGRAVYLVFFSTT